MVRKHTYSQHFLRNPRRVQEIIGHSNLKKRDTVIDIGAGSGILTSALSRRVSHVIAIESEPQTFKILEKNLSNSTNTTLVHADILHYTLPTSPYKVFSNIPFHLSATIVRMLTFSKTPPRSIYLIVQKQFARKIIMSNTHFTSQLGAELAPWWTCKIKLPLRKTDYTPPPNVDTVLLEIRPKEKILLPLDQMTKYRAFIVRCFEDYAYFSSISHHEKKPSEVDVETWCSLFLGNR